MKFSPFLPILNFHTLTLLILPPDCPHANPQT